MEAMSAARLRRPAALALAAIASLTFAACSSSKTATSSQAAPIPGPQGPTSPFVTTSAVEPDQAPAASAQDAVTRYVAAEASGDAAASYSLLADDDRRRAGSFAAWADEAGDRLPVRSIASVEMDGSAVITDTVLDARLDESGFVPARARIEWRPVKVANGWLVSPTSTHVQAVLPPDADAAQAVAAWLAARSTGATTGQYDGNLLGRPALLDAIAGQAITVGAVRVGAVRPLGAAPDPQVAVNAFGPEAERFVRTVTVDAPARLAVLVAPLGDAWRIVGVEAPTG